MTTREALEMYLYNAVLDILLNEPNGWMIVEETVARAMNFAESGRRRVA